MMQEITGDQLLDSDGPIEIEKPEFWTGEWVCERLIQGYETLRKIGGRIGPKEFGTCWAEYALEYKEVKITRGRAGYMEVELMEEALCWPATYMQGEPVMADAVQLWTWAKAWGLDIETLVSERRKAAMIEAEKMASSENQIRAAARAKAKAEVGAWAVKEFRRLRDGWAPSEYADKFSALQNRARIRLEREISGIPDVIPRPIDAAKGRVISMTGLRNFRIGGFQLLAERLHRKEIPVR